MMHAVKCIDVPISITRNYGMDLRALRHFVTLIHRGSFVAAAAELNLTQPALSRSMRALEDEIGLKLIERHRNGCVPTPAGELLFRDAAFILRQTATLQHNLRAYAKGDLGHLRFGAAPLPATLIVPRLLSDMAREQPGLTLGVALGSMASLLKQLHQNYIEFVLCAEVRLPRDPALTVTKMFDVPLSWLVRDDHPLASRGGLTLDDLRNFPFACVRSAASRTHEGAPDTMFDLPVTIGCDDYSILLATIRNCDAICLASSALLPANPGLVALEVEDDRIPKIIEIVAVGRQGREFSPIANKILQPIRECMIRHSVTDARALAGAAGL